MWRWFWVMLLLSALPSAWAQSTLLILRNGDRLTGTILREETNQVVFKTAWWNVVVVPQSEIKSRETIKEAPPGAKPPVPLPMTPLTPAAAMANVAVTPVIPQKTNSLSGEAQAGLDMLFSQHNRQLYSGRFKAVYTAHPFLALFDYHAAYGKTDGVISDNNMFGSLKTDWELRKRFYIYNLAGAGYDHARRIDLKYEVGPGLGAHVFTWTNFVLNAEVGADYQAEYRSDQTETESVYFRFAEDAIWKVTPRIAFDEKFEFFPRIEGGFHEYRFRLEANLRYSLLNNVSLIFTVRDLYDTNPAKDVPQNDLQLTSSIGVKF
jgi:hypothetical protein